MDKRHLAVGLTVGLLLVGCRPAEKPKPVAPPGPEVREAEDLEKANVLVKESRKLLAGGNFDGAEEKAGMALQLSPGHEEAKDLLAKVKAEKDKAAEAAREAEEERKKQRRIADLQSRNLIDDPSFEKPKAKDRWGHVFEKWGGYIYEGECEFRVSGTARTGRHSLTIVGGSKPKIRAWANDVELEPGRYRVRAYIRGLDIGTGVWNQTTELMFNGKYMQLNKNGTFGWTPLTYVAEVTEKKKQPHPSFGLMAPGFLWVDDVSVEKVGDDVALTPAPVIGEEEAPVRAPGEIAEGFIRCPECGYRNMPAWGDSCYACGSDLEMKAKFAGEPVKLIASFEEGNPFSPGTVVAEHATGGGKALRIDEKWASMDAAQDWTGYDYVKADVHTDAKNPLQVYFEVRDKATTGYWTRVNYTTVVPPGSSTLVIPTALYVGEKSRPGRPLILSGITRMVFSIGEGPEAPLYLDNVRLERDTEVETVLFDGLWAFDLGKGASPLMEGFTPLDQSKRYTKARGYGFKDLKVWRVFDVLQPDPLYEDFICIESGGIAIDVPDGLYHVFVNQDSPSGYWGEYQRYRERSLIVEGVEHKDTMDIESFKKRYFRFWDTEDLPTENTFDKYQEVYFEEKALDVEVADGQLNVDFRGENWGNCVSAVVVYPLAKAEQGERFIKFMRDRRRFHFDNYFKRVLHAPRGEEVKPDAAESRNGFVLFSRDYMSDVYCNDRPGAGERVRKLTGFAFAGELEPLTVSVCPLRDLGKVEVEISDLAADGGAAIPAGAVDVGYAVNRLSRVTMEGSIYTIAPRQVMPRSSVEMPRGITRRFWLTVKVPADAPAGTYRGELTVAAEKGGEAKLPVEFRVYPGTLDEVDVPAGPWGHTIDLPWSGEEAVKQWNDEMATKSLKKMREYGLTSCSGLPYVNLRGFKEGKPDIDFATGDAQMDRLKSCGFTLPVVTYCGFGGLNTYYKDEAAMKRCGFTDYSEFIKAVFSEIMTHADEAGWLPVYWNIGDEPIGDNLARSAENAEAYRKAFPRGPPWFTAASSFRGSNKEDGHFRLSKALHVADWNLHDEDSVNLIHEAGGDWAFYNGGNRWTYGVYMYKAAKQFGMKFRVSWHWNVVAGDPYYALDCREDDYAWCNSSPEGELIPSIHFERGIREGIDDYRYMLTLARLSEEKKGTTAAAAAMTLIADRMAAFKLGQRDHDAIFAHSDWQEFRLKMAEAIERLRK